MHATSAPENNPGFSRGLLRAKAKDFSPKLLYTCIKAPTPNGLQPKLDEHHMKTTLRG